MIGVINGILFKFRKMKKQLLFVCLGNICRSPSGEAVMNSYIKTHGLEDKISCDSAGTAAYHCGEQADARMQKHAIKRNYQLTSIARQFNPDIDFDQFDLIIAMDESNLDNLRSLARNNADKQKIKLMTNYCSVYNDYNEVPDPYYGGYEGFELVLDILEDACNGLLKTILSSGD